MIPFGLKFPTVLIEKIQKEELQQPQVCWILRIQPVLSLEPHKECSPVTGKLSTNFDP
jgi:hypothetical protein